MSDENLMATREGRAIAPKIQPRGQIASPKKRPPRSVIGTERQSLRREDSRHRGVERVEGRAYRANNGCQPYPLAFPGRSHCRREIEGSRDGRVPQLLFELFTK